MLHVAPDAKRALAVRVQSRLSFEIGNVLAAWPPPSVIVGCEIGAVVGPPGETVITTDSSGWRGASSMIVTSLLEPSSMRVASQAQPQLAACVVGRWATGLIAAGAVVAVAIRAAAGAAVDGLGVCTSLGTTAVVVVVGGSGGGVVAGAVDVAVARDPAGADRAAVGSAAAASSPSPASAHAAAHRAREWRFTTPYRSWHIPLQVYRRKRWVRQSGPNEKVVC
ncbi:MAG TPA: hypothetical protein VMZ22_08405 [Acidimicrobiales bacterium]|nr:hypothetical protein [Acidimicrobiales bacterium]